MKKSKKSKKKIKKNRNQRKKIGNNLVSQVWIGLVLIFYISGRLSERDLYKVNVFLIIVETINRSNLFTVSKKKET